MPTIRELEELSEILSIAVTRERAFAEYYSKAYKKVTGENARSLFSLLVEQEKEHELKLREKLREIDSELEHARLILKEASRLQKSRNI